MNPSAACSALSGSSTCNMKRIHESPEAGLAAVVGPQSANVFVKWLAVRVARRKFPQPNGDNLRRVRQAGVYLRHHVGGGIQPFCFFTLRRRFLNDYHRLEG